MLIEDPIHDEGLQSVFNRILYGKVTYTNDSVLHFQNSKNYFEPTKLLLTFLIFFKKKYFPS